MNYNNPNLLAALTERYVLGTMGRRARRRYGQLLDQSEAVAASVFALENTLSPLAWSLAPVVPSELVWRRIVRATGFGKPRARQAESTRLLWPLAATAMAAAFLVSALGWWQASTRPPEILTETVVESVPVVPSIGVVADTQGKALWVARIYRDLHRADLVVQNAPESQSNKDYELWILRDDGVPVSLGLMPQQGERSLRLDPAAVDALQRGSTLAVSLEPLGGSPEAVPTGPVLFTTALLAP